MSWSSEGFKEKLEAEHTFPGLYIFKFIVPVEKTVELEGILPVGEVSSRNSKNNKYTSITVKANMESSEEVISIYHNAHSISGIIAL